MVSIGIIDCAVQTPVLSCYNGLVQHLGRPLYYFLPPAQGLGDLKRKECASYVILGSYSNVEDRLDWQCELQDFLLKKIEAQVPVLGICFGHQLIADGFSSQVAAMKEPYNHLRAIRSICTSRFFDGKRNYRLVASHGQEIVSLGPDLIHLATSDYCQYEVIEHKKYPFLGVQCHPEASDEFIQTNLVSKGLIPNPKDKNLAQEDGLSFITNFFKATS